MDYRDYLSKNQVEMLPCMATFAVVVDAGSFVDASSRLGLTPSAVSKQVSKLESALSLRLLERSTRQLRVNAEGAQVYSHCKALLESSASVFRLKDGLLDSPQGLVRVSVTRSLYSACNQLMPEFLNRYPKVSVQLISDETPADFISNGIDIGILVTESPPLDMVARKLCSIDYMVCAAPNYLEKNGTPTHPSELSQHTCLAVLNFVERQIWRFSSSSESFDVQISGRYLSDNPDSVLGATIAGLGVSCLPTNSTNGAIINGSLITLLPEWKYSGAHQGTAWLIYQPNRPIPQRVKVMVEYLTKALQDRQSAKN